MEEGRVTSVAFSPDGKTIAAGYGVADLLETGGERAGGVVLWDVAARKRLVDDPLPVKEGRVTERGLQPRRQDHRGRIRSRRLPEIGGDVQAAWCCGTWPAASGWSTSHARRDGGLRRERGLQPGRQDHRGRIPRPAAAWCCGTRSAASGWAVAASQ